MFSFVISSTVTIPSFGESYNLVGDKPELLDALPEVKAYEKEFARLDIIDTIKSFATEFEIEDAELVAGQLEVLAPFNKKYVVRAYRFSENTPEEGIEAPFYYAEKAEEVLAAIKTSFAKTDLSTTKAISLSTDKKLDFGN